MTPTLIRHRFEITRRDLTVVGKVSLSPHMLRLTLGGPALAGFTSPAPDDHIKLFIPDETGAEVMRDYTPRRLTEAGLEVDFALHEAGPATLWAVSVPLGGRAKIAGPRGSSEITGPIERWVLVGDETALPAIMRRVEELGAGVPVTTLVAVQGLDDTQEIATQATHLPLWVTRADPCSPEALRARLAQIEIPAQSFVWVAAEANVARALKADLLARGVPAAWIKASGYWTAGKADAPDKDL